MILRISYSCFFQIMCSWSWIFSWYCAIFQNELSTKFAKFLEWSELVERSEEARIYSCRYGLSQGGTPRWSLPGWDDQFGEGWSSRSAWTTTASTTPPIAKPTPAACARAGTAASSRAGAPSAANTEPGIQARRILPARQCSIAKGTDSDVDGRTRRLSSGGID